jgi:hypothetical protein
MRSRGRRSSNIRKTESDDETQRADLESAACSDYAFAREMLVTALFAIIACQPPCEASNAAIAPAAAPTPDATTDATEAPRPALEAMAELDAWPAVSRMSPGINIGNTLENITQWETGWGNPAITEEYVRRLAALGFKTVRLPVAWDTYAVDGRIQPDKFQRVSEVVDWITKAGMFCVLNIHWDRGWIDSSSNERFPKEIQETFTPEAEKKYRSYWTQISSFFAGKNEKLIFEALNEETKFEKEGSAEKAYATLTRVNQLFIDTVRATGQRKRLLIVAGYTGYHQTGGPRIRLPKIRPSQAYFVHYTPREVLARLRTQPGERWRRIGELERHQPNRLFDLMCDFCSKNDIPAFIESSASARRRSPRHACAGCRP